MTLVVETKALQRAITTQAFTEHPSGDDYDDRHQ